MTVSCSAQRAEEGTQGMPAHTTVKEWIQEAESNFLCTGANLRQIDKHISFNHIKFFGNMKHFHRPTSKPQFLVIQPLVIGINDHTSTEDSPEGDFCEWGAYLDMQETKPVSVKLCNLGLEVGW